MAYDENGNYYFNPQEDAEDAELYQDEIRRSHVRNVVANNQRIQSEQMDFQNLWNESLQEAGLDQQSYSELYNADPQGAKKHLKDAMTHVATNISRGRDPKTGRFTKQQISGSPGQSVQQRREQGPSLAELKAKAEKGESFSEMDVIDTLFGDEKL